MTVPMPDQDEHLPDTIGAFVHVAGLEVQRKLFHALIEKADQDKSWFWSVAAAKGVVGSSVVGDAPSPSRPRAYAPLFSGI